MNKKKGFKKPFPLKKPALNSFEEILLPLKARAHLFVAQFVTFLQHFK